MLRRRVRAQGAGWKHSQNMPCTPQGRGQGAEPHPREMGRQGLSFGRRKEPALAALWWRWALGKHVELCRAQTMYGGVCVYVYYCRAQTNAGERAAGRHGPAPAETQEPGLTGYGVSVTRRVRGKPWARGQVTGRVVLSNVRAQFSLCCSVSEMTLTISFPSPFPRYPYGQTGGLERFEGDAL